MDATHAARGVRRSSTSKVIPKVRWTLREVPVHSAWMCELEVGLRGAFYATDRSQMVSTSGMLKAGGPLLAL